MYNLLVKVVYLSGSKESDAKYLTLCLLPLWRAILTVEYVQKAEVISFTKLQLHFMETNSLTNQALFETWNEKDGQHSPALEAPEPKPGCWLNCCPNTVLLVTEPKAGGAGWEPDENSDVDKDPKLGAFGWPGPWLWPNAGSWLAPNAGPAAGAEDPDPKTNVEDDPKGKEEKFQYVLSCFVCYRALCLQPSR